ncbi:29688_t:CDS:1, partial [Racocetra persica]
FGSEKHKAALEEIKRLKQELENILESANLAEIIESCQRRIVYVDNPSIEIVNAEEQEINRYKRKRIRSREKLLTHLEKICQNDSYVPPKLKELSAEIATYMESKIKLEQELRKLKEEVKEIKFTKDKSSKNELKRVSVTNVGGNIVERPKSGNYDLAKSQPGMFEIHSWQSDQEKFTKIEEEAKRLESKKSELEEKKKKLKKEIAKKEKIIRQRVLKHIFNNYDDIANE